MTLFAAHRGGMLAAMALLGSAICAPLTAKADMNAYPLPALPALGSTAGSKVVDPTFGTPILRITDGSSGNTQCTAPYSNIDSFNRDSTRFYVRCSPFSIASLYSINSPDFTLSPPSKLTAPPSGLTQYWLLWSGIDPDVVFGSNGLAVYAINVVTQSATVYTSASDILEADERFNYQISRSEDDRVFAGNFERNGEVAGYVAWRHEANGQNTRLLKVDGDVNEVQVDKTGRFLSVVMNSNGPNSIWDLSQTPRSELGTAYAFNHYDSGRGTLFTVLNTRTLGFRQLQAPDNLTKLLPENSWSYQNQQDHFSLRNDNELWALASRYRIGTSSISAPNCVNNICPFDDEIVQVATDGSQQVRRLAHHRSVFPSGGYIEAPMANISRNGRYVLFTSNWGDVNGRLDAFLLDIPPGPGDAPAAPRNLQVL